MKVRLVLEILPQPDDLTCGPTCLQAVYLYFGRENSLDHVISEVVSLKGGGTLGVYLGLHALEQGFDAILYTYDLNVFDPTWFNGRHPDLGAKLAEQLMHKRGAKFREASHAYSEFLRLGGKIKFETLRSSLLRKYLNRGIPILTGLSATYLYGCSREIEREGRLMYDSIRGEPTGHFVVLTGYEPDTRKVWIADPLHPNPMSGDAAYEVNVNRLISAIMLGIVTYDANMLIIQPRRD